jgi:acid phosphatase
VSLVLAAACAGGPRDDAPATPHSAAVPARPALTWHGIAQRPTKVLVVVEENKTQGSAMAGMPHLAALARRHGYTTSYRAVTHPSLPNYLAIAGGSTFGVRDDHNPSRHPLTGPSVFDRAIAAGRTAKTYAEAMPSNCALLPTAKYAVKHNPWAYFADPASRANCRRFDGPSGTTTSGPLRSDVTAGRLPNIGLLVPDICHDGHDCSLAVADTWLKGWLQVIMAGPDYRRGLLAIVVTFDEDDKSADNTVLTAVIAPRTTGVVATSSYTHYSLSRYLAELGGRPPLGAARTAPSLRAPFQL